MTTHSTFPFDAPHQHGEASGDPHSESGGVLAEKDVVDDYTLRRRRLAGAFARGPRWRMRPDRGTLGYLATGAALALLALVIVGMVAFVRTQLAHQQRPAAPRAAVVQVVPAEVAFPAPVSTPA